MKTQPTISHHATAAHHVVPLRTYFLVFIALLVLLALSVAVYYANWGTASILLGVLIAVIKALLIIFFFMHVRYSSRMTWLFAFAAFVWLAILIGPTIGDLLTRGWLPMPGK